MPPAPEERTPSPPRLSPADLHAEIVAYARDVAAAEPALLGFLEESILRQPDFGACLAAVLAHKLASSASFFTRDALFEEFCGVIGRDEALQEAAREDLRAVKDRDAACDSHAIPLLFFKGFQALQGYRVAHSLWHAGRRALALALQSAISAALAVDIHPAARIGKGILMDHATGVVIGETAVVGDGCSILHEVTLGGSGKESGDRHPKVEDGVLLGSGAKVYGNIRIGRCAKIAGGSVVLKEVPPHTTVAGVPAKVVGRPKADNPAKVMDMCIEENGVGLDLYVW